MGHLATGDLRLTLGYDPSQDGYSLYAFSYDRNGDHGFWWADDNGRFRRATIREGEAAPFPTVNLNPHLLAQVLGSVPPLGGLRVRFSGDQIVVERV